MAWWGSVRVTGIVVSILVLMLAGCGGEAGSGEKSSQAERRSRPDTTGGAEKTEQKKERKEEPTIVASTSMTGSG
jgi:hypothetical protein